MQLLSRMGYKNITGYLWYVEEEIIEKYENISPIGRAGPLL